MICAWKELMAVLPVRLRKEIERMCPDTVQEIRLRIGGPVELVMANTIQFLPGNVSSEEISFVVNAASRYSPWTAASMSKGYLTAPGGHRIGICGEAAMDGKIMKGFQSVRYLCIRIAKDIPNIASSLGSVSDSVLILGAPGWGKTTFLRDLIRVVSKNRHASVVDERGELFPQGFQTGVYCDVLSGCPKSIGIEMVLKTMGPDYIAVDEVTSQEDCHALLDAAHCGVKLLATAHASSLQDFHRRQLYQNLISANVFSAYIIMSRDKSWKLERIKL